MRDRVDSFVFPVAFAVYIPTANWLIGNVSKLCVPDGPCLISVVPDGIAVPSGVLMVGFALVLRDLVQQRFGTRWVLGTIAAGAALSAPLAPPALVVAAVLLLELTDFEVYTPVQRRGRVAAVTASSAVSLVVDRVVFLAFAFGSLAHLPSQFLDRLCVVLPAVAWPPRRDECRGNRTGLAPNHG